MVKLAEQGSTVLAAEAFRRAVGRVGRENVYCLVFEENRCILDAMDVIPPENVLTIDARTFGGAVRTGLALLARFRRVRVDAAISFEFFARSGAVLNYLSGAAFRVGLHAHAGGGPYTGDLQTHRLVSNPYLHASELFVTMVEALDQPAARFPAFDQPRPQVPEALPTWQPPASDLASVRRLLADSAGGPDLPPLVLLNANCSDLLPIRRWDRSRYVQLARLLLEARPEILVAFTGAPAEARAAEQLAHDVRAGVPARPRCVSLAGKTTMRQLLTLYSLSEVLVTNDSGPAHFASLTPIDVVTLFGPETPAVFAARTPRNHVLWAGIVCSPCVTAVNNRLSACRDNVCMQRLTVDQVLSAVLSAYDARQPRRSRGPGDADGSPWSGPAVS